MKTRIERDQYLRMHDRHRPFWTAMHEFVYANGIRSVIDAGCGVAELCEAVDSYTGIDTNAHVLEDNWLFYGKGNWITADWLALDTTCLEADLFVSASLIEHCESYGPFLRNTLAVGTKYAVVTFHKGLRDKEQIRHQRGDNRYFDNLYCRADVEGWLKDNADGKWRIFTLPVSQASKMQGRWDSVLVIDWTGTAKMEMWEKEMSAKLLSVIVPGRNEEFMRHTVEDVLAHSDESTEVIACLDGYWCDPPLVHHPRLQVIHFGQPVGQRAATNYGAHLSRAKYVMKLDAHCSTDEGFDRKLLAKMEPDMTMIPAMHRLHVFDWHCNGCGEKVYQGTKPAACKVEDCKGTDFTKVMVWQPRFEFAATTAWRFDRTLHFYYWRQYKDTPEYMRQAPSGIVETMSCIGCTFLMERKRFKKLGGMDESHGSWGQYGTELACKAWLSGGRMVTNLDTWISHLFRTGNFGQNGESSWPYPINQRDVDKARDHSRNLWLKDAWPLAVRPLSWLIEHFKPIPSWHDGKDEAETT